MIRTENVTKEPDRAVCSRSGLGHVLITSI